MAKKNKNKIFEQQSEEEKVVDAILEGATESLTCDTKLISPNEKIVLTKDIDGSRHFDLVPDESKESMVENVPDDPVQTDILNDKLRQISELTSELNNIKNQLLQSQALVEKLQNDNDMLIIKLAEYSAQNTYKSCKSNTMPLQHSAEIPQQKFSTNVAYINNAYTNNGYGTWH